MRSEQEITRNFRAALLHPVTLTLFVMFGSLSTIFDAERHSETLGYWTAVSTGIIWEAISFAFICFLGPRYLNAGLRAKVSFFWLTISFFTLLWIIETALYYVFMMPDDPWFLLRSSAVSLFLYTSGVILFIAYFRNYLEEKLQVELFDLNLFSKDMEEYQNLQSHLPKDIRGPILQILAQNQYIEIETEKGTHLLRMSLKEACGYMSEAQGWQVHRSRWVRKSQIKSVHYDKGTPFAMRINGKKFPISRSVAGEIKKHLERTSS